MISDSRSGRSRMNQKMGAYRASAQDPARDGEPLRHFLPHVEVPGLGKAEGGIETLQQRIAHPLNVVRGHPGLRGDQFGKGAVGASGSR